MTASIHLTDRYAAYVETKDYGPDRPVVVVTQEGNRTPGQWFASTLIERGEPTGPLFIDYGAGWKLDTASHKALYFFAQAVLALIPQAS
jgi:hypothetical protein